MSLIRCSTDLWIAVFTREKWKARTFLAPAKRQATQPWSRDPDYITLRNITRLTTPSDSLSGYRGVHHHQAREILPTPQNPVMNVTYNKKPGNHTHDPLAPEILTYIDGIQPNLRRFTFCPACRIPNPQTLCDNREVRFPTALTGLSVYSLVRTRSVEQRN